MKIRAGHLDDREALRALYFDAFSADEGPVVAGLAVDLLEQSSTPEVLHLVAELDGVLVGHVALSPIWRQTDRVQMGYILAPLAVLSCHQGEGIGSSLVEAALSQVRALGAPMVCVYGDPQYYGRFGFSVSGGQSFVPPYALQYPEGWHALTYDDSAPAGQFSCVPCLNRAELW